MSIKAEIIESLKSDINPFASHEVTAEHNFFNVIDYVNHQKEKRDDVIKAQAQEIARLSDLVKMDTDEVDEKDREIERLKETAKQAYEAGTKEIERLQAIHTKRMTRLKGSIVASVRNCGDPDVEGDINTNDQDCIAKFLDHHCPLRSREND